MALKFLWQMIKGEKFLIWHGLSYLVSSLLGLSLSLLLGNVVESVTAKNANFNIFIMSFLIYVGVAVVMNVTEYIGYIFSKMAFPALGIKATKLLYKKVTEQSIGFVLENNSGYLASKINSIYGGIISLFACIYHEVFLTVLMFVLHLCVIYYFVPELSISVFVISLIFVLIFYKRSSILKEKQEKYSNYHSKFSGLVVDTITNILLVKSFNGLFYEDKNFVTKIEKMKTSDEERMKADALTNVLHFILSTIFIAITLGYCGYLLLEKEISIATFVILNSLSMKCGVYLNSTMRGIKSYFRAAGTIENTLKTVLQETDIKDAENAKKLKLKKASIEFKDVDFKYSDGKDYIFKGFDLEISAGQKLGLVGKSGEGKS
ncbi:MAG: ABC transporter ATP-binding protein, partial [Proteobacteria bacterium]|nr:ABC transporter ATP-binding protein [Pseudomonadota bacterium]